MRWAYVLGPLVLVLSLGGLFLIPRPGGAGPLDYDRASLSLLTCHAPTGAYIPIPSREDSSLAVSGQEGLWVRIER
ncbi:MAG: hypothetical protein KJ048_08475 [Dehalococcoidia bacterium]|nr:hypothetical protein [Dehalococcoidia bacterium]